MTGTTSSPASPTDAPAGITEAMIRDIVHTFYEKVRRDDMLGPIFEAKVQSWPDHLAKMCDFWSSATLRSGRYKGHPMGPHVRSLKSASRTLPAGWAYSARLHSRFAPRRRRFSSIVRSGLPSHFRSGLRCIDRHDGLPFRFKATTPTVHRSPE